MERRPQVGDEERALILKLHNEGKSCTAIAGQLNRAHGTISRHAAEMGLVFDTERTAQATKVATVNRAARREVLMQRLMAQQEKILDVLEADTYEWTTVTSKGDEVVSIADHPPGSEWRNLAQSIVTIDNAISRYDERNADKGVEGIKSMLGSLKLSMELSTQLEAEQENGGTHDNPPISSPDPIGNPE